MKITKIMMGMPITIEIVDKKATKKDFQVVFAYFKYVDQKFSTYKSDSEISQINQGKISQEEMSADMKLIFDLAMETNLQTDGYFNVQRQGLIDPSGIVKGWAILEAAKILKKRGLDNFYIDAGGDIQVSGYNKEGKEWRVGIKNPFQQDQIVKVITVANKGVATSGSYIRGQHIYNPFQQIELIKDVVSLTVIGPNIYEADRFATAAFAMGKQGIYFLEKLKGFEGYMIDNSGLATMTSGWNSYVV